MVAALDHAAGAKLIVAKSMTTVLTGFGGTRDPTWDGDLARELADEVLELDGADHALARVEDLPRLVAAVQAFATRG